MKTLKLYCLLFILVLLATNCRKDEITTTDNVDLIGNIEDVKFQFIVTDENGQSISNAQILIQSEILETDLNGVAISSTYSVPTSGLKAEISASGYHSLDKMVNGPKNSTKQEKIILIKSSEEKINTGGTGIIDGGGTLLLPPILNRSDGSTYSGEVKVKSKYLNPDNDNFLLSAPGNLLGLNDKNEFKQLASLGMYMIELMWTRESHFGILMKK